VRRAPLLLLPLVLTLAACGAGAKTYTDAKTKLCLRSHGARITPAAGDIVASTATGGAFRAYLSDNFVTVVFGATQADANNINDAYHRFAGQNVGIADVLRQQGNAVMLWHAHPQATDLNAVIACLK
jgi:hypothetical protein